MYAFLNIHTRKTFQTSLQRQRLSSMASKAAEVKKALGSVMDPVLKQPILHTGMVRDVQMKADGVMVNLDPVVPGHPFIHQLASECKGVLNRLGWVRECDVQIELAEHVHAHTSSTASASAESVSALAGVRNIIAVSSCKGGVGKSTVAVNLAFTLAKRGLRVGLLDADIYGPSLPYMVKPLSDVVRRSRTNPKNILPLEAAHDLKMLSFGHVNPKAGVQGAGAKEAAVLRGPVASKVVTQMVVGTEWGELDYLVVDMPPGTGDIQITLSQCLPFTGAVIVTTPHHLSLVDAAKGVAMFQHMQIPTLALVENMSYFMCHHGEKYYPFGQGGRENLLRGLQMSALGVNSSDAMNLAAADPSVMSPSSPVSKAFQRLQECPLHSLPLSQAASSGLYGSTSASTVEEKTLIDTIYGAIADDTILEIYKLKMTQQMIPMIGYAESSDEIILRDISSDSALEHRVPAIELRVRDPVTGLVRADPNKANKNLYAGVKPVKFDTKGNYGVAINWSDGHYADIFPYEILRKIAKELKSPN